MEAGHARSGVAAGRCPLPAATALAGAGSRCCGLCLLLRRLPCHAAVGLACLRGRCWRRRGRGVRPCVWWVQCSTQRSGYTGSE